MSTPSDWFGYSARLTYEKLRVAEALEGLPETARELESGSISFSAVRELTRVAELRAKAYGVLVRLGFRELEAKHALAKIPANSSQGGDAEAELVTVEVLVRAALRELPPNGH